MVSGGFSVVLRFRRFLIGGPNKLFFSMESIFCKRKRRFHLIVHWHSTGSLDYLEKFIETVLFEPTFFSIQSDSFSIFRNLHIQYNWLTSQERDLLNRTTSITLTQAHRRELVRDVLILGFTRPDIASVFALMINGAIQRFMLKYPYDVFIKRIYFVCQGVIPYDELICY